MFKSSNLPKNIHFVGIGGIHMSGIAKILHMRGHKISGSDINNSSITEHLKSIGILIYSSHESNNMLDSELAVYTSAINSKNPEIIFAQKNNIPIISRSQIINIVAENKKIVAIGGSHGKTTITTLLSYMLLKSNLEPLVLSGGLSADISNASRNKIEHKYFRKLENIYDGTGEYAIIEADEYKDAFLQYNPSILLINNIDDDHLDYFKTTDRLRESFLKFGNSSKKNSLIFLNKDSDDVKKIGTELEKNNKTIEYYSIENKADWMAKKITGNKDGTTSFELLWKNKKLGSITTNLSGRHNILNLTASIAIAMKIGISFQETAAILKTFQGIQRRFTTHLHSKEIVVVDDYAHHPVEIKTTIAAVKIKFPGKKIIGCFQPHTFSRTKYLLDGFISCFKYLDELIIAPTYAARETPDKGIESSTLSLSIKDPRNEVADSLENTIKILEPKIKPNTVILILGAGDISEIVPIINEKIRKKFNE
ncbi:MAG: UDP-N-acetylmuramate--alanine ligase [Chloroflexi bacterium]|jgi:UDP-N-acetylmuramate--alanine ligase|nr:MAG: UDP-N-acetylmuramate--alanine ligase [Chloroflexota bacterium]|tara:strand:- start:726 stop:2168 length:1443 start_codon:yes stop_codon:yes gene_type:complete